MSQDELDNEDWAKLSQRKHIKNLSINGYASSQIMHEAWVTSAHYLSKLSNDMLLQGHRVGKFQKSFDHRSHWK